MGYLVDFELIYVLIGLIPFVIYLIILKIRHVKISFSPLFMGIFIAYIIILFMLTMLPLPIGKELLESFKDPYAKIEEYYNLIPFSNLFNSNYNLIDELIGMFKNVLLFVPFGYLYNFTFSNKALKKVLFKGFMVSFIIEVLQFLISKFYIQAPFRYFDVNDLIMNSLGTMVGYLFWKLTINYEKRIK